MKTILAYQLYIYKLLLIQGHAVNTHNKQRLTQITTPIEKMFVDV